MLTTHHLEFSAKVRTPMILEEQAGSSLRGALIGALWNRFCVNKTVTSCSGCSLKEICPVAQLVAPMRDIGESGGEQRPRPYVTRPPVGRTYAPGESLRFGLALFGRPSQLFPYIVMAASGLSETGMGRPVSSNRGRRGQADIVQIDAVDPLTGSRETLYTAEKGQVYVLGLPISSEQVAKAAIRLPRERLRLRFHTPLRLIEAKQLMRTFQLRPFIQRLIERLNELGRAYGQGPLVLNHRAVIAQTERVRVIADNTRWVDVISSSSRQGRSTPIGGLIGSVDLEGEIEPLREWLAWGSIIHVGKNAVKGDGWYSIEEIK